MLLTNSSQDSLVEELLANASRLLGELYRLGRFHPEVLQCRFFNWLLIVFGVEDNTAPGLCQVSLSSCVPLIRAQVFGDLENVHGFGLHLRAVEASGPRCLFVELSEVDVLRLLYSQFVSVALYRKSGLNRGFSLHYDLNLLL